MSEQVPPGPPFPPANPPPANPPPANPPPGWTPPPGPPLSSIPPTQPKTNTGVRVLVVGLAILAALLVVGVALLAPRAVDALDQDVGAGGAAGRSAGNGADEGASLQDVLVVADLSNEHRDDVDVEYDQVPPIGGPHDPEWLACGAFDEPLRDENAVHDLEHGTVWITYAPDLAAVDVATLEAALPDDGILSPYIDLPAPVVVTVWGVQLRLSGADDPRLLLFIDEYGDGSTAPEPFASCEGGVTDPRGGAEGVTA